MKKFMLMKWIWAATLATGLMACTTATPPPQPAPPPPATTPVAEPTSRANAVDDVEISKYSTAAERTFAEGLNLYDRGEYAAAIKKFRSPDLAKAWPDLHVRVLKYIAFSYCLTNQLRACQQAFYDALQINPDFNLLPSERGHPIWGPVFQKAKLGPPKPSRSTRQTDKKQTQ